MTGILFEVGTVSLSHIKVVVRKKLSYQPLQKSPNCYRVVKTKIILDSRENFNHGDILHALIII